MSNYPDKIWAQDKTLPGDPAKNGYWETRPANGWAHYLYATPTRLHADELVDALSALVLNIDAGGATLGAMHDARALLALIEGEKP